MFGIGATRLSLKDGWTEFSPMDLPIQLVRVGSFKYMIGPLGSPASIASPLELDRIKELFKKYCPEEPEFNWWYACYKVLHQGGLEVDKEDLMEIEGFIRNNGGMITDSQEVIKSVVQSIEKYIEGGV